jgi:hypothetical protein
MKLGVILLAFLLAAMVMVPMVNAAEQNATTASAVDVSKIQLPQLQFNNSQTKVVVTGELSPEPITQSAQVTALVATKSSDISKIPYGSIIYHSKSGVTTVFDSTGKQLFATNDSDVAQVSTPQGLKPATQVHEIPSGSIIYSTDNRTYIFYNNQLILTTVNSIVVQSNQKASTSSVAWPPAYIEGAESSSLTNVGQFTAQWNVPASPQKLKKNSNKDVYRSQLSIWNGIQSNDGTFLIQPVLEWAWKDKGLDPEPGTVWTGASWYLYPSQSDSFHSTRIRGINPGDNIEGNMLYNKYNNYWTVTLTDITRNIKTTYWTQGIKKSMPNNNVQIQTILEAGNKFDTNTQRYIPDGQYICGGFTFNNFYLVDTNGNNILPKTIGTKTNSAYWPQISGLFVGNSWPSKIVFNTGR